MTDASKIASASPVGLAKQGPATAADSMIPDARNISEADVLRSRINLALGYCDSAIAAGPSMPLTESSDFYIRILRAIARALEPKQEKPPCST